MSHDHPVDPYKKDAQALLNMVRKFHITGTSQLLLQTYVPLSDQQHAWLFTIDKKHYALLLDSFMASANDGLPTIKKLTMATAIKPIKTSDGYTDVTETDTFDSIALYEYEVTL